MEQEERGRKRKNVYHMATKADHHLFRFCEKHIIGQNISSSQGVLNFIVSVPPRDDPGFLLVGSRSFIPFSLGVNNPPEKD